MVVIEKSFRLSKGFWHKFLPHSSRLFSPQNIPIELWDVEKRIREGKWNPGIYGIENLTVSNDGNRFAIMGGWITSSPNRSECKIYDADTLLCLDQFSLYEKCTNPKFTPDDKHLVFGTWDGNLYQYDLEEQKLTSRFTLDGHMFHVMHHGALHQYLYAAVTRTATEQSRRSVDFVLEYDALENTGNPIRFGLDDQTTRWSVSGLALHEENLAVLLTTYGGQEDGNVVHDAKLLLCDTKNRSTTCLKEDFKIRDVFDHYGSVVWNHRGNRLAFIGLHKVYIVNMEHGGETAIPFERATSVEFSNCDTGLAVGGAKAKMFKIE